MPVKIDNPVASPDSGESSSHWLNYHHLYYFYIIAREGSIARASTQLRVGQPTLSTQLKLLEDSIQQRLFDRSKKKLTLTEAGRIAFQYSEEVFKLGSEMVEAIHDRLANQRIHVQIGALDSVPKHFLVDVINKAYEIGQCSVSVLEGKADELMRELTSHKLDLVVSNFAPATADTRVYSRSIAKSDVVICGASKYQHLAENFPKSLDGQPFVLPTQHSRLRGDLEHYFRVNEIRVDIVAETQDTSIQKLLGHNGIGLIALSEYAAQEQAGEQKLMRIGTLRNVTEELWLLSAARKIQNPIAAQLMKEL